MRPRSARTRGRRDLGSSLLELLEDRHMLATFNPLPTDPDGSPGSLRAAIIQADSNGQDNTINLAAGTYELSIANSAGQENGSNQGDLDLTGAGHTITIQGAGAAATIIDGGKLDRVFQIFGGVTAVLSGLTIQNGVAQDGGTAGAMPGTEGSFGGGILNLGTATLNDVVVQNCLAAGGFGTNGTAGNVAAAAGGGLSALGGGIFNSGTLMLIASAVIDNTAEGGKGGDGATGAVDGSGGAGGGGSGGGIFNGGSLTVFQSTIAENNADGGFGGDAAPSFENLGYGGGSGGDAFGGGLDVVDGATATLIINSTIAGNTAGGGFGGQGGDGGQGGNPMTNMGDEGGNGGNGGTAKGGGIAAFGAFSVYNSTIAGNQVFGSSGGRGGSGGVGNPPGVAGSDGFTGPSFAGGIWAPSDPGSPGVVTSVSTIVALNTSVPAGLDGEPDDVEAAFGSVTNTLLGLGAGATGITSGVNGNIVGVDPRLGPLQDNGGPTPTMALLPGSPAIDAGANPLDLTTDQRGYSPRAFGIAADIGAYELGADAPSVGGGGGSGGTGPVHIKATVIKVKGHREVRVTDPATGAVKFTVFPFGKAYRGHFVITTADVNGDGVSDLIVRRPLGRKKFMTRIFSGVNGSPLPSNVV